MALLERLTLPFLEGDPAARERVQAAVLLLAGGDSSRLRRSALLAETDWRDLLVAAGLADQDWPQRVNVLLDASTDAAEPGQDQ